MNPVPKLASVIVVNWNGLEYLPACLDSIQGQTYEPKECIIVDNGSSDGSREWLRSQVGRGFRVVELEQNRGFAGGANAGIQRARGEYIALLNNDATADSEWLFRLVAAVSESRIGMVATKILFHDRREVIDKAGHLLYQDGLNRGRGAGEFDRCQYDDQTEVFFPDGCAALYRRTLLDDVGLFDEQFFAYGDDADLGLRARWLGWNCVYAPLARVYHRHSSSLGKYSVAKAFLVERNRIWVALKLFPLRLLVLNPWYTAGRYFWHVASIINSSGLAGGVTREHGGANLLGALLRAYASALAGLPKILAKRSETMKRRRLTSREFIDLVRRYRISARELALRD